MNKLMRLTAVFGLVAGSLIAMSAHAEHGDKLTVQQTIRFPPGFTQAFFVNGQYRGDDADKFSANSSCMIEISGDNVSGAEIPAGTVFTVRQVDNESTDCTDDDSSSSCVVEDAYTISLTSQNIDFISCSTGYGYSGGYSKILARNFRNVIKFNTREITN